MRRLLARRGLAALLLEHEPDAAEQACLAFALGVVLKQQELTTGCSSGQPDGDAMVVFNKAYGQG